MRVSEDDGVERPDSLQGWHSEPAVAVGIHPCVEQQTTATESVVVGVRPDLPNAPETLKPHGHPPTWFGFDRLRTEWRVGPDPGQRGDRLASEPDECPTVGGYVCSMFAESTGRVDCFTRRRFRKLIQPLDPSHPCDRASA